MVFHEKAASSACSSSSCTSAFPRDSRGVSVCSRSAFCNFPLHHREDFKIHTSKSGCNIINNFHCCPGWRSSVDRVLACEHRGHWFDSQSGHMPGLRARSPVGGMRKATDWCISHTLMFLALFLSFSLLPPLFANRWIKSLKINNSNNFNCFVKGILG